MSGKKKLHKILILLAVLAAVLAGIAVVAYGALKMSLGKSNYVSDEEEQVVYETLEPETSVDEEGNVEYITEQTLDSEEEASVKEQISDSVQSVREDEERTQKMEGVYDLLLIGVDRRDDSWYGNSDVMILLTVNHDQKTVYMTSFLRDLAADIPGVGVRKLNAACAHGGAQLLVETLEENYAVSIDNYAMVDFNGMIQVVDALGGIDLELTDEEVSVANDYVKTMCEANGEPYEDHEIKESGLIHLDGYQAVGHARNRYSGNTNDFGRTDRQRDVLMAIIEKAQDGGLGSLTDVVEAVLPYITHNISDVELLTLMAQLPTILEYQMVEQRIPYDDLYHSENEMLVPDMEETIQKLHDTIYGD